MGGSSSSPEIEESPDLELTDSPDAGSDEDAMLEDSGSDTATVN